VLSQRFGKLLRKHNALGAEEDDIRWAKACLNCLHGRHDGLWLHDHAGTPTIRGIVRDMVAIRRKVTQVMDLDLEQAPLLGTLQNTGLERGGKHFRKNGENMCFHRRSN
jgi:hypothetical protein